MKVKVQTFGCSLNMGEGEIIKGLLRKEGFELVDEKEDVSVVNVCTVKGTENVLRELRKIKSRIVLTGCISDDLKKMNYSMVDTHNLDKIVEIVKAEGVVKLFGKSDLVKLALPKVRQNEVVGIIPISSGCLGDCSYCSVKLIKGEFVAYPRERVIGEARKCLENGCKELWITAQDSAAHPELISILEEICSLEGDFFVRVGMMNPMHLMEKVDGLIEVFKNDKMFKFLHLPVQSGSDKILKLMKRDYTVEEFIKLVKKFRDEVEDLTLSTDVIVGFPGEDEDDFSKSLELIEELKPEVLNISRFRARPGTEAYNFKDKVEGGIIKDRSRVMTKRFNEIALQNNEKWIGWKGRVLIDEIGKNNTFVGRNFAYRPVIVKEGKIGGIIDVKIRSVTEFDLRE